MKIGTRVSLWYVVIMAASLLLLTGVLYFELVIERKLHAAEGTPTDTVEHEIAEVVLFYGVPSAVLLVTGGWWLMRRALKPLNELTAAAEKIHAGALDERLPRTMNQDELDRLTEAFNVMIARLEDSFARIREFTLNASHELKTPLAVLHAGLETMINDPVTTTFQRDQLAGHLDEIQRLSRIVQGLAFLARADAGQIAILREPVPLNELVRDIFADAQVLAQPSDIEVTLKDAEELTVAGDRHRLRQLLLNLADNAIKHNRRRGTLTISLRRDGDDARLELTNTGAGVATDKLRHVFDRFFRGESTQSEAVEGSGLGLSIALWIVKSHGGTIEMNSIPGESTTVLTRLPLAKTEPLSRAVGEFSDGARRQPRIMAAAQPGSSQ